MNINKIVRININEWEYYSDLYETFKDAEKWLIELLKGLFLLKNNKNKTED